MNEEHDSNLDLDAVARFLAPDRVWRREDVLRRPCPIPAVPGVYGWWFDQPPALIDSSNCQTWQGLTLLYTGISPKRPPVNGRPPSKGQLRQRIRTHYSGNAEGSTLRKTLGCLLADELGIQLRRVGSGRRRTLVAGEQVLSAWMAEHAFVSVVKHPRPWELEDQLIATLDLPLNLDGNSRNAFHGDLSEVRRRAVATANELPVVPNPGVGGR
ncbi:hypothetical protein JOD57_004144 [Geodermatophilus bullaregiensis]|uniref:GIY-YIG nuclease family protein n=1 Tax=Geodermatophilus bullaregiensis TaxID=1564160 RepID=UPI00195C6169|nr:hypothetical protein [Geodermatophilus bullaregiensis]MBM7808307.1 hypothetical protein [Geodermatophilus bullaregiensis]